MLVPVFDGLPQMIPCGLLGQRLAIRQEGLHHQGIGMEAVDLREMLKRDRLGNQRGGCESLDGELTHLRYFSVVAFLTRSR